ncbi:MAG: ABC transporter permease [Candidatus Omnitrophica bacterium]|nr:ABC transporter permease [Candidatus Omnitrophota bacterium]
MYLKKRFNKLSAQRQILSGMVRKNLRDKYVGSHLGYFWAIINPLLLMIAINFVFTNLMKTGIKNFPSYVLSALLPFFFFVNSLTESTTSMEKNKGILNQFIIVREIIPIAVVCANFMNFLFGFIIILPFFAVINMDILRYIWLLPAAILLHFIFTLGACLLFSIVNVYCKDLAYLLNIGVMLLFWMTPIFYSAEVIPLGLRWIVWLNPASSFAVIYRSLLYSGSPGSLYCWVLAAVSSFISISIGYYVFIKRETDILKYI